MKILGISSFDRAAAAALLVDGKPVAAAAEERFTRRRRDAAFPSRAIAFCLRQARATAADLDHVVYYEKPLRRFERVLVGQLRGFPRTAGTFSRTMFTWLGDRLWMKSRIAAELGVDPAKVMFVEHHQAHAAAAFFTSPFDDAAVLIADGVGEWATTSLGHGRGRELDLLDEIHLPHSLGSFTAAVAAHLGFRQGDGPERLMELAAWGSPDAVDVFADVVQLADDGSFALDASAFARADDPAAGLSARLCHSIGEPRSPDAPLRFGGDDRHHANLAAAAQTAVERSLLHVARRLHERAPAANLCLGGELALNGRANARLAANGPFDRLFVPAAPDDDGAALGAALYVHHVVLEGARRPALQTPFLGEAIADAPGSAKSGRALPDDDAVVDEIARRIAAGDIVGWARQRFALGPAPLGHRTIVADPSRAAVVDRLRTAVKPRARYRPFATAVTEEAAPTLFALPVGAEPAAAHAALVLGASAQGRAATASGDDDDDEGRGRVHVVSAETDPIFHKLLRRIGETSGAPVLLATSLNLEGEPPARGARDAHAVLARTDLDALVIEREVHV